MKPEKKITVSYFRKKKSKGEKLVTLSLYDAATAKLAEACGVELILVGDSLGNTMLGYENTLPVTLEQSLHHTAAVRRGAKLAFVVGDMPFMTYQVSIEEAMRNAARYLKEALADAVKIEGGKNMAPTVKRLVDAGIPVLGHIGLLPQNILTAGGYRLAGKTEEAAERMLEDALALQDAGAFAVVIEGTPAQVSKKITGALKIPTIGIGAGVYCDGQVQVVNDILGLFSDFVPKHTKQYVNLTEEITKAFNAYAGEVLDSKFPGPEQSF